MAFVLAGQTNATTSATLTGPSLSPSNINYGIACITVNTTTAITGVTDNKGQIWEFIGSDISTTTICRYLYRMRLPVATSFTNQVLTTKFASSVTAQIEVVYMSGRAYEAPEEGVVLFSVDGFAATSHSLSTIAASAGDDLIAFASLSPAGTVVTFTLGGAWVRHGLTTACRLNVETQNNVATGSYQTTFTTSGTAAVWGDALIAVRAAPSYGVVGFTPEALIDPGTPINFRMWFRPDPPLGYPGPGAVVYTQALSASQGSASAIVNSTLATRSASIATSATLPRSVAKIQTASQATAATVARAVGKLLAGITQATSATLITGGQLFTQALNASVASAATMLRSVQHAFSLSVGQSASVTKSAAMSLSASQGATTVLGRTAMRTLAIAQGSMASLQNSVRAVLASAQATSGALSRAMASALSAVANSSASLAAQVSARMVALAASVASTAQLARVVSLGMAAGQATGAGLQSTVGFVRSTTTLATGALLRAVSASIAAAQAVSASLSSHTPRAVVLVASQATAAGLGRAVAALKAVGQGTGSLIQKSVATTRAAAQGSAVVLTASRMFFAVLAASQAVAASLARGARITLAASVTSTAAMAKLAGKIIATPVMAIASLARAISRSLSTAQASLATIIGQFVPQFYAYGPEWIAQRAARLWLIARQRSWIVARALGRAWSVSDSRAWLPATRSARTWTIKEEHGMSLPRFDEKDPGETVPLAFSFDSDLLTAEMLSGTPTVTIVAVRAAQGGVPIDPSPSAILDGPATLDATKKLVVQPVFGGFDLNDYEIRVEVATTNPDKVLVFGGILPVRTLTPA